MKKYLLSIIGINLFGMNLNYALHQTHAFPFIKRKTEVILEYQKLNDTIDILNIKEQELGSLSNYGSIGDMNGYKINITHGLTDKITLNANINKQDIEYGDSTLSNKRLEIFTRYNFLQNELAKTALSVDIGGIVNYADKIIISNNNYLKSLAKKFLNVKDVIISNNKIGVIKNDGTTEILNLNNPPSIDIDNLNDKTIYLNFLAEKKYGNLYLCGFFKINYTNINTTIKANINPADASTQEKLKKYNLVKNLDRNEKSINVGFNISWGVNYIFEVEYYYSKFFRDSGLDYIDYNHVVNIDVVKPFNKKWFIYAGGKVMYRQFNGEIPYLYNKYSQTTFDHKYGFARVGIGFVF